MAKATKNVDGAPQATAKATTKKETGKRSVESYDIAPAKNGGFVVRVAMKPLKPSGPYNPDRAETRVFKTAEELTSDFEKTFGASDGDE